VSVSADDGLVLRDLYVGAVNRSAPPGNRPTPEERDNCLPYLVRELSILGDLAVVVALGAYAWDGVLRALAMRGVAVPRGLRFGHGAEAEIGGYRLLATFHPSQQNTFTGKLTADMLDAIFRRARVLAGLPAVEPRG
jgi:uracil-DNA glycosylase family 4